MNAKLLTRLSVFAVAGVLVAGCASQQGTNTAVGTGVGAATGAGLGAIFGGGKGAAIGAGVGAAVGGVTGYNWQAIKSKISGASAGTGTQVTEQQDGSLKVNIPNSISFDTNSYAIKPSFTPVLNESAIPSSSPTPVIRSRISPAARTARRASSSCARGIPKTAMTASPMNFSTVPPWCSTTRRISSKYRLIVRRSVSGSSRSPRDVEPLTSQKSTVTVLRTSRATDAGVRSVPHAPQNLNPSGFSCPQFEQRVTWESLRGTWTTVKPRYDAVGVSGRLLMTDR